MLKTIHREKQMVIAVVIALASIFSAEAFASNPGVPWPATDSLGRSLPLADEVGPPK